MTSIAEINRFFTDKLAQPLKFGDGEQIRIIREWLKAIEEFEAEEQAKNDPNAPFKKYLVQFSWRTYETETVEARSAQEAREIIQDYYEFYDDFEIESVNRA
jgi:hypothetical protein